MKWMGVKGFKAFDEAIGIRNTAIKHYNLAQELYNQAKNEDNNIPEWNFIKDDLLDLEFAEEYNLIIPSHN